MNIQLNCYFSHDQALQKYANAILIETRTETVYQAEISENGPIFTSVNTSAFLRPQCFVIVSCFQDIKILANAGVNVICLDKNNDVDFSDYEIMNPKILISGPINKFLTGDFLLRLTKEAISTCTKTRIKLDLKVDIFTANNGDE